MRQRSDKQQLRSKEIGERIAQARREADGMTQRELADLLGVTERSVAAYESGDVIPYRFMRQLEEILQMSASWFLYGEEATGGDPKEILSILIEIRAELKSVRADLAQLKAPNPQDGKAKPVRTRKS